MPKKPVRNAYYFFMLDFKEEQRRNGIHYANMGEVQVAADPSWRAAKPAVRAKYEQMAKQEKENVRGTVKKFTSTGVPIAEIKARQMMEQEIEQQEIEYISSFVKSKRYANNKSILNEDIYIIDVNAYCNCGNHYLMGESTVLRFNLAEGIKDVYHTVINPGRIPTGYVSDAKVGAAELGLDMPDEDKEVTNYLAELAHIMDYLKTSDRDHNTQRPTIPPLFTLPEKVLQVKDYLRQLCDRASEYESDISVYKLDYLLFYLANDLKVREDEGYPKLSLATAQLRKDVFRYAPKMACEHHTITDNAVECTASRCRRWAFTILDKCCPIAGIDPVPGKHVPKDIDLESIITYKERVNDGNEAAGFADNASSLNISLASEPSVSTVTSKPKRVYVPLRPPKQDRSSEIVAPPELTQDQFPPLMGERRRGGGMGRGSIGRGMSRMTLND